MAILFGLALAAELILLGANATALFRGGPRLVDRLVVAQTSFPAAVASALSFAAIAPSLPPDLAALVPAMRFLSLHALVTWGLDQRSFALHPLYLLAATSEASLAALNAAALLGLLPPRVVNALVYNQTRALALPFGVLSVALLFDGPAPALAALLPIARLGTLLRLGEVPNA